MLKTTRIWTITFVATITVLSFGGTQCVPQTQPALGADHAQSTLVTRNASYHIHCGDSFEINFPYLEDFNQTVTVQPDGMLILKTVGSIRGENLTLQQLELDVKTAYSDILKDPVFTISPKDLEKPFFIAAGRLVHPGKYDLRSNLSLSEAVAMAGGFNDQSLTSQVVLFRKVNSDLAETRVIDVKKMLASRDLREDLMLKPGDMIFVPQNTISKITRFMPSQSVGMYFSPLP